MKIYWGWKDVPELAGLSRRERCKVARDGFLRFGRRIWQFWVGVLAMYVFAFLGAFGGAALRYGFGFSATVGYACAFIGLMVDLLMYSLLYYSVVLDRLRPHFRDYIAQRRADAQQLGKNVDDSPREGARPTPSFDFGSRL
jgi:hypothetical protein